MRGEARGAPRRPRAAGTKRENKKKKPPSHPFNRQSPPPSRNPRSVGWGHPDGCAAAGRWSRGRRAGGARVRVPCGASPARKWGVCCVPSRPAHTPSPRRHPAGRGRARMRCRVGGPKAGHLIQRTVVGAAIVEEEGRAEFFFSERWHNKVWGLPPPSFFFFLSQKTGARGPGVAPVPTHSARTPPTTRRTSWPGPQSIN